MGAPFFSVSKLKTRDTERDQRFAQAPHVGTCAPTKVQGPGSMSQMGGGASRCGLRGLPLSALCPRSRGERRWGRVHAMRSMESQPPVRSCGFDIGNMPNQVAHNRQYGRPRCSTQVSHLRTAMELRTANRLVADGIDRCGLLWTTCVHLRIRRLGIRVPPGVPAKPCTARASPLDDRWTV